MAVQIPQKTLLDEVLDFIVTTPTLEQLIAFKPSREQDNRLQYLMDQNSAGSITPEERAEFDRFLQAAHVLKVLKLKARIKFAEKTPQEAS